MKFGPIQLLVIGFDNNENFRGEIIRELDKVRGRGIIRIIDGLFVAKDKNGNLFEVEKSDLSSEEALEFGSLIARMMGLDGDDKVATAAIAVDAMEDSFGLGTEDLREIREKIKPGTAGLIVLIEHVWAVQLKGAVANASGHMIAQGMLTNQALLMIGKELEAIADAEITLELADAVKGAAVLEALGVVAEARYIEALAVMEAVEVVELSMAIKAAAVADAVRALVIAGLIEEAAVEEAIEVLAAAELIESSAIDKAVLTVEAKQDEVQSVTAAVDAAG